MKKENYIARTCRLQGLADVESTFHEGPKAQLIAEIQSLRLEISDPDTHPEDREGMRHELHICKRELRAFRE